MVFVFNYFVSQPLGGVLSFENKRLGWSLTTNCSVVFYNLYFLKNGKLLPLCSI